MQHSKIPIPEESKEIAKKIDSGEFFRESMNAYYLRYVDLISERYFYVGIVIISIIILIISLISMMLLYPLRTEVPFIFRANNMVEDFPIMKRLDKRNADVNIQIKQFLIGNYIKFRENYSIDILDRNASGVKSQSTDEVFQAYQRMMDPQNPASPITLYQRQSTRSVEINSMSHSKTGNQERVEANVTATITTPEGSKKQTLRAIITFSFDDIKIDQNTGDVSPLHFIVTSYETEMISS